MDVIGQTDITDDEQVKMHLNLLEVLYDNNYFVKTKKTIIRLTSELLHRRHNSKEIKINNNFAILLLLLSVLFICLF